MGDKEDDEGLDIWDTALIGGGALAGRAIGRRMALATKRGKKLVGAEKSARAAEKEAEKAWYAEYEAAKKRLQDAVDGKIKISKAEELELRRTVSLDEVPGSASPALRGARSAMDKADDAWWLRRKHQRWPGRAGALAGGSVGYGASKFVSDKPKQRK